MHPPHPIAIRVLLVFAADRAESVWFGDLVVAISVAARLIPTEQRLRPGMNEHRPWNVWLDVSAVIELVNVPQSDKEQFPRVHDLEYVIVVIVPMAGGHGAATLAEAFCGGGAEVVGLA